MVDPHEGANRPVEAKQAALTVMLIILIMAMLAIVCKAMVST